MRCKSGLLQCTILSFYQLNLTVSFKTKIVECAGGNTLFRTAALCSALTYAAFHLNQISSFFYLLNSMAVKLKNV